MASDTSKVAENIKSDLCCQLLSPLQNEPVTQISQGSNKYLEVDGTAYVFRTSERKHNASERLG